MESKKIRYFDCHCHLDSERFKDDLDNVVKRAHESGVQIVHSGINPNTNKIALELKKKYDVLCTFGVYPIDAVLNEFKDFFKNDDDNEDNDLDRGEFDVDSALSWIEENKDECVGIGEVGLDFKFCKEREDIKEAQIKNFEKIISLAKKLDKTLVIHSRGAETECTEILEKNNCKKVLMHCFSGKKSLIKRGVENKWFFSVPPVIKRLQHFETLVNIVPISQLVTETDAPYLSAVYGERNESKNVIITVNEIAHIKEMDVEEVRKILLENARRLYGL
jgi:TatD DNase family protein